MVSGAGNCGLTEAGLLRGEAVTVEGSPTAAQSLLERYPITVRHHVVQNRIYCTVNEEKHDRKSDKTIWRHGLLTRLSF